MSMNTLNFRKAAHAYATALFIGLDKQVAASNTARLLLETRGLNAGLAQEIALDVQYRLAPDTEKARYERLLALHDWHWRTAETLTRWHAGKAERDYLLALSLVLDKDKRVWNDYSPAPGA